MVKWLLLVVLILLIMLIAKQISKQYKDRHQIFCDILDFVQNYKLNVGFKKEKIKLLTKKYTEKTTVLGCYNSYIETGNFDLSDIKLLSIEEKTQIKAFLIEFGNGDFETEKKLIAITENYLQQKIDETKGQKDKWCPMIIKLSFLFSLGVAILFV